MKPKTIDRETAKADSKKYKYVYLRELSRFNMGEREKVIEKAGVNWNEVIEARFFDENGELRFFRDGDELKAVPITDDVSGDYNDTVSELMHDHRFGHKITVREYLDYDEDGQVYVIASRLVGWEA